MPTTLGVGTAGITYNDNSSETSLKSGVRAIFGYGVAAGSFFNLTNLVNNYGGVATDTTGVGTARSDLAAAGYGGDKAIFGYGQNSFGYLKSVNDINLISNIGVVVSSTTSGADREKLAAAGYGGDKAIFGYGFDLDANVLKLLTTLVSNIGIVASDITGVGTARQGPAAASYSS